MHSQRSCRSIGYCYRSRRSDLLKLKYSEEPDVNVKMNVSLFFYGIYFLSDVEVLRERISKGYHLENHWTPSFPLDLAEKLNLSTKSSGETEFVR